MMKMLSNMTMTLIEMILLVLMIMTIMITMRMTTLLFQHDLHLGWGGEACGLWNWRGPLWLCCFQLWHQLQELQSQSFHNREMVQWCFVIRPRRWIVTIPSLDQWLATIGNHWKTIVSNEKTIEKPSVPMVCQTQNHWKTIVSKGKTIEKPLVPMVGQTKTIEKPSSLREKTIEKPLLPMVCQTKNHR